MPKLLLDVDTGIDDSFALVYLLASPEADILGISCTAGNVPAAQVAANNVAWLELCGRAGVEVCLGATVPLIEPLRTTEETHGLQGIGWAELPVARQEVSSRHAVELWSEVVRAHPGQVIGLVTGPLTNLALAVKLDPELPLLLGQLVVMGGAFQHPGNTTPTSEWNIAVDPDAAKVVFDAFSVVPPERRPIICPLDVTELLEMTPVHMQRLAAVAGSTRLESLDESLPHGARSTTSNQLVRHLSDAIRFYFEFHRDWNQGWIAHMHDAFAAAVALDPQWAVLREACVDVEVSGRLTRGTTIADWSGMWGRAANARIAVSADPDKFFTHLTDRIGSFARSIG